MKKAISAFFQERTDEILRKLSEQNAEYALSMARSVNLYEMVRPILDCKKDITICRGDCENLQELWEEEIIQDSIRDTALYRQGYLDCIELLHGLGILS